MNNGFVVIRPVCENDLHTICEFGDQVGIGFISLVSNPAVMMRKIEQSLSSFSDQPENGSRLFFFVMEYCEKLGDSPVVVGTCAIDAPQGKTAPFYSYKLSTVTQISQHLNKYKQHKILELVTDYQNTSLFSTVFLQKPFRGYHRGELLSRSRCLFISEFPHFFSDIIFSQMRGLLDDKGGTVFWDSIGRYFFEMDFKEANDLRIIQGEQFISDLMPTYPIYTELLSKEFQDTIGAVHVDTRAALKLLDKEGFRNRGYVDIFDGGPIVEAYKSELKTMSESQACKIHTIKPMHHNTLVPKIISNTRLNFRVTLGVVEIIEPGFVCIDESVATLLQVSIGDNVRFCDLHKKTQEP